MVVEEAGAVAARAAAKGSVEAAKGGAKATEKGAAAGVRAAAHRVHPGRRGRQWTNLRGGRFGRRLARGAKEAAKGAVPGGAEGAGSDAGKAGINPLRAAGRGAARAGRSGAGAGGGTAALGGQAQAAALRRGQDGSSKPGLTDRTLGPGAGNAGRRAGQAAAIGFIGAHLVGRGARRLARTVTRVVPKPPIVGRPVAFLLATLIPVFIFAGVLVWFDNHVSGEEAMRRVREAQWMAMCFGEEGEESVETVGAQVPADMDLDTVLAALRGIESDGDYDAYNRLSEASGAYQFLPGTWGGYEGYDEARDAPPAVQDRKARENVLRYLRQYDQHWSIVVPVAWNPGPGHLPAPPLDDPWWGSDEDADAGGTRPGDYRQRFLDAYNRLSGGGNEGEGGDPAAGDLALASMCTPDAVALAADLSCPPRVTPIGDTDRVTEPGQITDATQALLDAVVPCFGRGNGIGCFDARDGSGRAAPAIELGGPFEHPRGRACDFMLTCADCRQHGDVMAEWLKTNAEELNILYVIWYREIWSTDRADEGWRPYTGDSPHTDHVHVSIDLMPDDPAWARCPRNHPCSPYWGNLIP